MAIKYTKAPVSEITFGVFFKTNALIRRAIIFEVITKLNSQYPILQTANAPQIEEIQNENISTTQDVGKTGHSTYWLSSSDFIYKIDINQISLNFTWQRRDDMPSVSVYPGFSTVYEMFKSIFKTIVDISANKGVDLIKEIRLFSLKYSDRLSLKPYIEMGVSLPDIIKVNYPPIVMADNSFVSNNYLAKYSIQLPYLNGYSIVNVNTPTYPSPIGQSLLVDNRIKGYSEDMDMWFEKSHQTQLSFFENFFTERILNDWK